MFLYVAVSVIVGATLSTFEILISPSIFSSPSCNMYFKMQFSVIIIPSLLLYDNIVPSFIIYDKLQFSILIVIK